MAILDYETPRHQSWNERASAWYATQSTLRLALLEMSGMLCSIWPAVVRLSDDGEVLSRAVGFAVLMGALFVAVSAWGLLSEPSAPVRIVVIFISLFCLSSYVGVLHCVHGTSIRLGGMSFGISGWHARQIDEFDPPWIYQLAPALGLRR